MFAKTKMWGMHSVELLTLNKQDPSPTNISSNTDLHKCYTTSHLISF